MNHELILLKLFKNTKVLNKIIFNNYILHPCSYLTIAEH